MPGTSGQTVDQFYMSTTMEAHTVKNLVSKVVFRFPDRWRTMPFLVRAYSVLLNPFIPFDPDFRVALAEAVAHCSKEQGVPGNRVRREMLYEYVRTWVKPGEFYKFQLLNKDIATRNSFVSGHESVLLFKRSKYNTFPDNKDERYRLFASFYRRDILHVRAQATPAEREEYQAFVARHPEFIAKTIKGTKGHGIQKLTAREAPDVDALIARIGQECLVEELIDQGPELATFHPQSVNTIRFASVMNESGEYSELFALMRTGRGGSIVDNVGSGGLIALIDMESGVVCTDGLYGLDYYETHPDTHVRFRGTQIPEWKALCETAREMHSTQPGQRLFGFDFAWTTKGWDVVEVNPQPSFDSYQSMTHEGIRPIFMEKGIL